MTANRACLVLWPLLFVIGLWLAMHRPLWADEITGQKIDIEESSWSEVFLGQIKGLNNPPLFFALQKTITSLIPLQFPDDLKADFSNQFEKRKYFLLVYPKGQIVLRILPDIFISTAIVVLVRFFWIRAGAVAGVMALLSILSSGMVWRYWVEARPYALWFFLTIIHTLLLIDILSGAKTKKIQLALVNWLLILTVTPGFIQVIMAQAILFLSGERRWKYHWWSGILPVIIALSFFWIRENKTPLYVANPLEVIRWNFSLEMLLLLLFYMIAFFIRQAWIENDKSNIKWEGLLHLPYFMSGLLLALAAAYLSSRHSAQGGIPIYPRYFIYLSATSAVLIAAMFADLWNRSKGLWRGIFTALFMVLLMTQFMEGFTYAWFQGYFY